MKQDDLERFADDLRGHTGLEIGLVLDPSPDGLHVLTIEGADFFFYADSSGYDGCPARSSRAVLSRNPGISGMF